MRALSPLSLLEETTEGSVQQDDTGQDRIGSLSVALRWSRCGSGAVAAERLEVEGSEEARAVSKGRRVAVETVGRGQV